MKMQADGQNDLRQVFSALVDSEFMGGVVDGVNWTIFDARKAAQGEMRRAFDRPTAYALNSLYVVPATTSRLVAELDVKDDAAYFMRPQTEGGARKPMKMIEQTLRAAGVLPAGWFVVPGQGAALDGYGNMLRGQSTQILSQLRVQLVGGFDRAMSRQARAQINAQRRAGGRFFVRRVGDGRGPGVYQREFTGRNVTPVLMFVKRARYQQRLPLGEIVQRTVDQRLQPNVFRGLARTLQRLSRPGTQRGLF